MSFDDHSLYCVRRLQLMLLQMPSPLAGPKGQGARLLLQAICQHICLIVVQRAVLLQTLEQTFPAHTYADSGCLVMFLFPLHHACRPQLMLLQMPSLLAGPRLPGARLAARARQARQQGSRLLLLLLLRCCRSRSSCSWLACWQ
jgi:hypothetical protein